MEHTNASKYYEKACKILPGGVNSPVRAFQNVHCLPIIAKQSYGAYIVDIDDYQYIDYIGSWGPMILGHQHPYVMEGFQEEAMKGISYGLCNTKEYELAHLIVDSYKGMDMIRFVTSGTEATMSALRVARAYAKRDKVIKFAGCYHGHHDAMLSEAGSGALTFSKPNSDGVNEVMVQDTLIAKYNDINSVMHLIKQYPNQIAAIILEPIAANMGLIPAHRKFLQDLRTLCNEEKIVLIFDEVITGFRVGYGSCAQLYQIEPDLACFGKIIGGGMSVGAYGGKKEIMKLISPCGGVYQAGTLSGNPLAMHMGIRQLTYLKEHPEVYTYLEQYTKELAEFVDQIARKQNLNVQVHQVASLMTVFFHDGKIESYEDVQKCNTVVFENYFKSLLKQGILCAPSPFETMFISYAHKESELKQTKEAMKIALEGITL